MLVSQTAKRDVGRGRCVCVVCVCGGGTWQRATRRGATAPRVFPQRSAICRFPVVQACRRPERWRRAPSSGCSMPAWQPIACGRAICDCFDLIAGASCKSSVPSYFANLAWTDMLQIMPCVRLSGWLAILAASCLLLPARS